jgi:non-specific serine/threonine protein kinase
MKGISDIKNILEKTKRISSFDGIEKHAVSERFNGELRLYQKAGFDWLNFLRDYGFSGCLADDMGLGKTVQTIAFLQSLKDRKKIKTSLLVVPVSAISNWESEIEKFSTSIYYLRYIGIKRYKSNERWGDYDLVITSYATLRNDIDVFMEYSFDYVILDESQNIKNYNSQTSKAIKLIKSEYRLALSGTPIENNSFELWSLFDFLMPGYLGSISWFKKKFERQNNFTGLYGANESAELLKKMVFPFMLRRKKEEVEKELPPKTEIIIKLKMNEGQRDAYNETSYKYVRDIFEKKSKGKKENNTLKIIEGILRLRQICLFPEIANDKYTDVYSAKAEYFKDQIREIIAEGHKVLVFSQFTKVLNKLKEIVEQENIAYSYLDGQTNFKNRDQEINKFQKTGESSVFLLSLKAGGVAINLTEADYVIVFDPWWNPAVEAQAIDRAHRIGQKKNIIVYRMIIEDSIEEKIIYLQEKKKDLFESIITTDAGIFKNLSKEELFELFK